MSRALSALDDRIKLPAMQRAVRLVTEARSTLAALPGLCRELGAAYPVAALSLVTGDREQAFVLRRWDGSGRELALPDPATLDERLRRQLFADGQRLLIPDTAALPLPLGEPVLPQGCRGLLWVPVRDGKRTLGALCLATEKPGALTPADSAQLEIPLMAAGLKMTVDRIGSLAAERERVLGELTTILRLSRFAIVRTDGQGRITWWNRGGQELFGHSREEAVGTPLMDLLVPQDRATLAAALMQTRRETWAPEREVTLVNKNGTRIPARFLAYRMGGLTPGETGTALAFQDRSEWKQMEARRDAILAGVSHEMRTPLANISAYTELLRDHRPDTREEELEFLDIITTESSRLTRLIGDILDLASLQSEGLDCRFGAIPLAAPIARALREMALQAEARGITLEGPGTTPGVVLADPDRLHQVLLNLVANAVKFTPAGGRIRITVQPAGDHWEIRVDDTGPGIPEEERERVFDRFYQTGPDAHRRLGTGLGLAICRAIMNAHAGHIRAAEAPGGGGRIIVSFPSPTGDPGLIDSL